MTKTKSIGMNKGLALATALALATTSGLAVAKDDKDKHASHGTVMEDPHGGTVTFTEIGEVTDVDKDARAVTLKWPDGTMEMLPVGAEVRNFDQIKAGDRLRVDYRAGLALALVKGGDGIREKVESEGAARAQRGAKPGGAISERTTIVANVERVDRARHLATLKGPEGRVVKVRVDDPAMLKDIQAGDQVVANVTTSLAVNVRPAPAK